VFEADDVDIQEGVQITRPSSPFPSSSSSNLRSSDMYNTATQQTRASRGTQSDPQVSRKEHEHVFSQGHSNPQVARKENEHAFPQAFYFQPPQPQPRVQLPQYNTEQNGKRVSRNVQSTAQPQQPQHRHNTTTHSDVPAAQHRQCRKEEKRKVEGKERFEAMVVGLKKDLEAGKQALIGAWDSGDPEAVALRAKELSILHTKLKQLLERNNRNATTRGVPSMNVEFSAATTRVEQLRTAVNNLKQQVKNALEKKGLLISDTEEWGKKARSLALEFERECLRLDSLEFDRDPSPKDEANAKTQRRRIVREIQFELRFLDELTRLLSASTDLSKLVREPTAHEVKLRSHL
jgi:hypothetical protein